MKARQESSIINENKLKSMDKRLRPNLVKNKKSKRSVDSDSNAAGKQNSLTLFLSLFKL